MESVLVLLLWQFWLILDGFRRVQMCRRLSQRSAIRQTSSLKQHLYLEWNIVVMRNSSCTLLRALTFGLGVLPQTLTQLTARTRCTDSRTSCTRPCRSTSRPAGSSGGRVGCSWRSPCCGRRPTVPCRPSCGCTATAASPSTSCYWRCSTPRPEPWPCLQTSGITLRLWTV